MIKLQNVNKYFGTHHVLKDINLTINEGEKLVIIGPSGSGKSTTIRCMNGLEEITSGKVIINDIELTHKTKLEICRKYCAMVFQHFNLYPHMSVLSNLTLAPMKLQKKSKKEAQDLAYKYLKVVGLEEKAHAYPSSLSGGQQQRVGIARAFVTQPKVVFADEPTGNLDTRTTAQIMKMITEMARKHQQTIVLVTHDPQMAVYADRIVTLIDGEIVKDERRSHEKKNS